MYTDAYKTKEETEQALFHLMYQFRQMNRKYGLMVTEEINLLYKQSNGRLETTRWGMEQLKNKLS